MRHLTWRPVILVLTLLTIFGAAATADPSAKKQNGNDSTDLAPLGGSGESEKGPLAGANFPAFGSATNGGGPNPNETGPVDSEKARQTDHK
jgi:hypothetical protein